MKYHLGFKNFHIGTMAITEKFFLSGPWTGTPEEKQAKFEKWLQDASRQYGVPAPTLEIVPRMNQMRRGGRQYGNYTAYNSRYRIRMGSYSVVTLFHEFRHHLQYHGVAENLLLDDNNSLEQDAAKWSCSLFYRIRPHAFRKAVREGKINSMHPRDLLKNPEEWVEPAPNDGNITPSERSEFNRIVERYGEETHGNT